MTKLVKFFLGHPVKMVMYNCLPLALLFSHVHLSFDHEAGLQVNLIKVFRPVSWDFEIKALYKIDSNLKRHSRF